MAEEAIRQLQTQFQTAFAGLQQQNAELQTQLQQSRQQGDAELEAVRAELRSAQQTGARVGASASQGPSLGVDTRLLGKPSDFQGTQETWHDWCAAFKGYAGAAVPRLQRLMLEAQQATEPVVNATVLEEADRAASAQLYWMLLMICKAPP